MKKLSTIFLLLACGICRGQNLVPNPSFEIIDTCPYTILGLPHAIGWSIVTNTPEYFNACCTGVMMVQSVPNNIFGGQPASTGSAYAGLCTYSTGGSNFREQIGIQLSSPLIVGTLYYASFKISSTGCINPFFNGATSKTGMLFSTVQYNLSSPAPINNFSQIYTDSILMDTTVWVTIKGSFIADSAYTFITIGNFFDDLHTDTSYIFDNGGMQAYYFIDDICVSTDSLTCNSNSSTEGISDLKNGEEFLFFPNPFQDKINITAKRNESVEVCLYDITTRKLMQKKFLNFTTLNIEHFAKGIYIYEVRNKNGVIQNGKVVKE